LEERLVEKNKLLKEKLAEKNTLLEEKLAEKVKLEEKLVEKNKLLKEKLVEKDKLLEEKLAAITTTLATNAKVLSEDSKSWDDRVDSLVKTIMAKVEADNKERLALFKIEFIKEFERVKP
jgi:hypothetical protein